MAYGTNAPFGLRPICSINGGSWTEKVNKYNIYASADGATTYSTSIFTGDPVQFGTSVAATPAANGLMGTIARWTSAFADDTPSTFAAKPVLGVFMGCEYFALNNPTVSVPSKFWPASTQVVPGSQITAFVLDDPNVVYDIQVSTHIDAAAHAFVGLPYFPNTNATGGFALAGSFGRNFALNIGGGTNFDTVYGPVPPYLANTAGVYANNPAAGSALTGESAFYLDVSTPVGGDLTHDYSKVVTTLPVRAVAFTPNVSNVAAPGLTLGTTPFLNVMVTLNNPVYAIGSVPSTYVA